MNVMFIIDGTLVTPATSDSILNGITRKSVLELARSWGMKVEERKVSVAEIEEGLKSQTISDAFGVGTAATIAHIELIGINGVDHHLPGVEKRDVSNRILKELDAIKRGTAPDPFGWIYKA